MIRKETPRDIQAIRKLNDLVFSRPVEGSIVDAIRKRFPEALSLVAVRDDSIVGHLFFSPVVIAGISSIPAMGLGPMAVLPEFRRQGIGTALVTHGIKELQSLGCAMVFVLGHAEYYAKFGFAPASRHGLACPWAGVADDAFMVKVLRKEYERVVSGTVRYAEEFSAAI